MWNEEQKEKLIYICKKYNEKAPENVIFTEPYLPYVPEKWNGILVLAESQVINDKDRDHYYNWLKEKLDSTERMNRLGQHPYKDEPEKIGIGPWDNGTVKLALQAIFEGAKLNLKLEEVAVSNAVPWTKKRGGSRNESPDKNMQDKAKEFWKDIFDCWKPKMNMLIVLGNIAEEVMNKPEIRENYGKNQLKLISPSPRYLNFVRGPFDCNDAFKKFPMVQKAFDTLKIGKDAKYYKNKVFYACQAIIRGLDKFKECFCE